MKLKRHVTTVIIDKIYYHLKEFRMMKYEWNVGEYVKGSEVKDACRDILWDELCVGATNKVIKYNFTNKN